MHWDHRVGRRLKLRDLNILLAISETGSMAKAAARLAISQPAISRAIADMEHTLGVRLLDRSATGVQPTAFGDALIRRGVAVFDELRQGVQDIAFLSDPGAGELRVGASPTLAEGIVTTVIGRVARQYPRAVFHVSLAGASVLYASLRERRVELGFTRIYGAMPEDLKVEVLFAEPLVVVSGVHNPWARRRKVRLGELVDEPWTWPSRGTLFEALVVEAFRASGVDPPRATVYCDPFSMRLKLAATGPFLTVVPTYILRLPVSDMSLKVLPIDLPTLHRQVAMVTLKDRAPSALAEVFMERTREVAKLYSKPR